MSLNTEHLEKCLKTLDSSLKRLNHATKDSIEYDIFRNAAIKGFELSLETSGKLLRKALKQYKGDPKSIDQLTYKAVLRHAAKHDLLTTEMVERWFQYRDNRFAEETLILLPQFLEDAQALQKKLDTFFGENNA